MERAYRRVLASMFDAQPGEVILGSGASPGQTPGVRVFRISAGRAIPDELVDTQAEFVARIASKTERWAVRRGIAGSPGRVGTAKHEYARRLLLRHQAIYGQRGLTPEVRYSGGGIWRSGVPLRGSMQLDVVEGLRTSPTAIYDYKFGTSGLQPRYVRGLIEAGRFPKDALIVEVRP
ncbi:MAG: hypothetical protein GY842_20080 [bacterium]|nr:hypothetical protein [bacterium]